MKENIIFKDSCLFKNSISEITSISLDTDYNFSDNKVEGNFIVEGSYKTHELSINQENFSYKLPFEYIFINKMEGSSIKVDVKDFNYTLDDNNLNIEIEYEVSGEEIKDEFVSETEFEKFLTDHEVDLVKINEEDKREVSEDTIFSNFNIDIKDEVTEEEKEVEEEKEDNRIDEKNMIMDEVITSESEYITYHVYYVKENESIEMIASKYNISVEELKNYNNLDEFKVGMKLIIPCSNE